jgi:hypothetical protein
MFIAYLSVLLLNIVGGIFSFINDSYEGMLWSLVGVLFSLLGLWSLTHG